MSGNRKAPPKSTKYATSATNLQIGPYVISKRSKIHVFACIHFRLDPRQTPSCEACHRSSPGGRRATKGRRWAGSPPSPWRAPSPHGEPPLPPRTAPPSPRCATRGRGSPGRQLVARCPLLQATSGSRVSINIPLFVNKIIVLE